MLKRLVARSGLFGFSPLQFWKMMRIVLWGRGSGGSLLIVMRDPFGVVWSFVGRSGRVGGRCCDCDGCCWFGKLVVVVCELILVHRRSSSQRRCQCHLQQRNRHLRDRFDYSPKYSCL